MIARRNDIAAVPRRDAVPVLRDQSPGDALRERKLALGVRLEVEPAWRPPAGHVLVYQSSVSPRHLACAVFDAAGAFIPTKQEGTRSAPRSTVFDFALGKLRQGFDFTALPSDFLIEDGNSVTFFAALIFSVPGTIIAPEGKPHAVDRWRQFNWNGNSATSSARISAVVDTVDRAGAAWGRAQGDGTQRPLPMIGPLAVRHARPAQELFPADDPHFADWPAPPPGPLRSAVAEPSESSPEKYHEYLLQHGPAGDRNRRAERGA